MIAFQRLLNKYGADLETDGIIGKETLKATNLFVLGQINKRGWVAPNTDLVYIRTDLNLTNTFDDYCVRFVNGIADSVHKASTTAGKYYIYNPLTYGGITGVAIAKEQQVINSHQFNTSPNWKSLWLGAPYFQQVKPIAIYRDTKKDAVLDKINLQVGLFGINFHRAGMSGLIDNWSAGCQVMQDNDWFETIKPFENKKLYTFTLIELNYEI
jgi:hypothetical protein